MKTRLHVRMKSRKCFCSSFKVFKELNLPDIDKKHYDGIIYFVYL